MLIKFTKAGVVSWEMWGYKLIVLEIFFLFCQLRSLCYYTCYRYYGNVVYIFNSDV